MQPEKDYRIDSQEEIDKCLSCNKNRCNNCVGWEKIKGNMDNKQKRPPIDKQTREAIEELLNEGHSDKFVANKVGCSRSFVCSFRTKLNIPSTRRNK